VLITQQNSVTVPDMVSVDDCLLDMSLIVNCQHHLSTLAYVRLVQCVLAFGPHDVESVYEDGVTGEQDEEVWSNALDSIRTH